MTMKKISLLCLLLLTGAASIHAEEFTFNNAMVAAGGMVDLELNLSCTADKWGGFQFDLRLPDGITIFEDEEGFYCIETDRLTYTYRGKFENFGIDVAQLEDGSYRFLVDNNRGKTIPSTSGTVMTIRLVCAPKVPTKSYSLKILNQKLANVDGSESVKPVDNYTAGTLIVRMDTEIGNAGYATFSWPLALDFTDTGVEAYIGTAYNSGRLQLSPVTKVPANTGLILKGAPGIYHPTTYAVAGVTDDVSSNQLSSTAEATVTATAGSALYALANNNGVVGFYQLLEGVTIPMFKAYLNLQGLSNQAPAFIGFDDPTTDVSGMTYRNRDEKWYRTDGTVYTQPRSGININQGQKILIK